MLLFILSDTGTPAVTYDYGYGRTYDTTKTYYQQAPANATYAAAAQPYDTATQSAPKVGNYQTAQYVAGPTRNNVQQQQAKVAVAAAPYNANQTYTAPPTYQQNAQTNVTPKRKFIIKFYFYFIYQKKLTNIFKKN